MLVLDFDVVIDETKIKAQGEHLILGKYCLELGTFEKMKNPLILPKSLQKFSLDIEIFTLMCKDHRKKVTLNEFSSGIHW